MSKSLRSKMRVLDKRAERQLPNELFKASAARKAGTMKHKGERRSKDARNNRWED